MHVTTDVTAPHSNAARSNQAAAAAPVSAASDLSARLDEISQKPYFTREAVTALRKKAASLNEDYAKNLQQHPEHVVPEYAQHSIIQKFLDRRSYGPDFALHWILYVALGSDVSKLDFNSYFFAQDQGTDTLVDWMLRNATREVILTNALTANVRNEDKRSAVTLPSPLTIAPPAKKVQVSEQAADQRSVSPTGAKKRFPRSSRSRSRAKGAPNDASSRRNASRKRSPSRPNASQGMTPKQNPNDLLLRSTFTPPMLQQVSGPLPLGPPIGVVNSLQTSHSTCTTEQLRVADAPILHSNNDALNSQAVQTTYADVATGPFRNGFEPTARPSIPRSNAASAENAPGFLGGKFKIVRSEYRRYLPLIPRISQALPTMVPHYGLNGADHQGFHAKDPDIKGNSFQLVSHWICSRNYFISQYAGNRTHYISPVSNSPLHWFYTAPPSFFDKRNVLGSVYQGIALATMFWHGVFQDEMTKGVYQKARSTTDPPTLAELVHGYTRDSFPDAGRTRTFYESGKALAVLSALYLARISTNSNIAQALLNTGRDNLVVLGHDMFWEAGVLEPTWDTDHGTITGYNWAGQVLMYVREILWKEQRKYMVPTPNWNPQQIQRSPQNPTSNPPSTSNTQRSNHEPRNESVFCLNASNTPDLQRFSTGNQFAPLASAPEDPSSMDDFRRHLHPPSPPTMYDFIQNRDALSLRPHDRVTDMDYDSPPDHWDERD
jgi:predicted NAD-dependent protein-ADP-ribosyltransferase YbiA (DUF1768 family)